MAPYIIPAGHHADGCSFERLPGMCRSLIRTQYVPAELKNNILHPLFCRNRIWSVEKSFLITSRLIGELDKKLFFMEAPIFEYKGNG